MVAKGKKSHAQSPRLDVQAELDNKALKLKNSSLTQTVAKLQQENAELVKQINQLHGESFEISSKYNNLKNVMSSIIDSTTKSCLPKLNEVVDTFTGIIQLCSFATNISNFTVINSSSSKDIRTQAVKPQIVNGHILHNPTITLSRLVNDEPSDTSRRTSRLFNDNARPSTSRGSPEISDRMLFSRNLEEESNSDEENFDNEGQDLSFRCRGSMRLNRKLRSDEDSDDSDEENEDPGEQEESNGVQREQVLPIIQETEEEHEEQELMNSVSPQSRQRRFLQGRLQEVKIYLNQLPNTYIEQFQGSGNISISVSPPERRSSYKYRPSSIMGDANESRMGNEQLYVQEQLSRSMVSQGGAVFNGSPRVDSQAQLTVSLRRSGDFYNATSSNRTDNLSEEYPQNISPIRTLQTPSTSANSLSDSLPESTPIVSRLSGGSVVNRSNTNASPNRSKNDSLVFKTNITKRKMAKKERRKVAQVLLNRLSIDKSLSRNPTKALEDIVNVPVIRKSSELKLKRNSNPKTDEQANNEDGSDEENVEKQAKSNSKGGKKKKGDSPTQKAGSIVKVKTKTSPTKSVSNRPKRAARPKSLKEPNLHKKMRRSK